MDCEHWNLDVRAQTAAIERQQITWIIMYCTHCHAVIEKYKDVMPLPDVVFQRKSDDEMRKSNQRANKSRKQPATQIEMSHLGGDVALRERLPK